MRVAALREWNSQERRCAITPETARRLGEAGWTVLLQKNLGQAAGFPDGAYGDGVEWEEDWKKILPKASLLLLLRPPEEEEIALLRPGSALVGFLRPFDRGDRLRTLAERGVRAISLELLPRTTLAQSMDVLSSQAGLAGYAAVIRAASLLPKLFPMLVTPAGTVQPARIFVIGAGVAGLQAIATARRLGALVEAFDSRPAVEEQVRSLGAKFLRIDLGQTGATAQGYALELSEEQREAQRRAMLQSCARADAVITTAKVFGKKAPILVTREMLDAMRPGSLAIDLAVEAGGNVEGLAGSGDRVSGNGVRLIGLPAGENDFPATASQLLANNLAQLILHLTGKDGSLRWNLSDGILSACAVAGDGRVLWPKTAAA
ncbi:MAG: NAD(P) transhydrogenase subunit alpha [Puniceicoccales bacterium]|jgi:NAD(P) transhydrogenase subunit alpha|nr:NAD(P) transhydrogenase subunit alpha [Puniceicoccales bacterium]